MLSFSDNSIEKIVKGISDLKINISNSFDKIEDSLINEFKKLTQLNEAIKIQTQETENLYGIKAECRVIISTIVSSEGKETSV